MSGPTTRREQEERRERDQEVCDDPGRAAPTDTLKNSDPASETAKNESAKLVTACVAESRAKGIGPKMRASNRIGVSGPLVNPTCRPARRAKA